MPIHHNNNKSFIANNCPYINVNVYYNATEIKTRLRNVN